MMVAKAEPSCLVMDTGVLSLVWEESLILSDGSSRVSVCGFQADECL